MKKLTPAEAAALQIVMRETSAQTIARIDQALAFLDGKKIVFTGRQRISENRKKKQVFQGRARPEKGEQ